MNLAECHSGRKVYCRGLCKDCYNKWFYKATDEEKMEGKFCNIATCHPNKKYGALGLCESCYSIKWSKEHPEGQKKWLKSESGKKSIKQGKLKYLYGISLDEWNKQFQIQNGSCAICKRVDLKLFTDHDHITGKFRGLLCMPCNMSIGHYENLIKKYPNEVNNYLNYNNEVLKLLR